MTFNERRGTLRGLQNKTSKKKWNNKDFTVQAGRKWTKNLVEVNRGVELGRVNSPFGLRPHGLLTQSPFGLVGPLGRVWEMGEERACNGSSKRVERGRKGEITRQCLKFAIEKWLNDGKNKRWKFASTFQNERCQEKQRRKKLKTHKCAKQKWLVRRPN